MPSYQAYPIPEFLSALASASPAPGGGTVAPLVAALGVALASMCANLTLGKAKYAEHEENTRAALAQSETLIPELLEGMERDAEAFSAYMTALKLPKEPNGNEPSPRRLALKAASQSATELPLSLLYACEKGISLCESLLGRSNKNVYSDLAAAAVLIAAAAKLSLFNVCINLPSLDDAEQAGAYKQKADALCQSISTRASALQSAVMVFITR